MYLLTLGKATGHVEVTLQAYCLLHGQVAIDGMARAHEAVEFEGRHYLLNPPLGGAVMLPFVAIFGTRTNQTAVAALVGAASAALVPGESLWLVILWAFGTNIWYEATTGDSWGFALILSTIPMLLAIRHVERDEPGEAGIWNGLACLARFDLAATVPVFLSQMRRKNAHWFFWGLWPALVVYFVWSRARFGTSFDQAERMWWEIDSWGKARGAPMSGVSNLPLNLFTALFSAPLYIDHFPWFRPIRWGQSLLLTTPALFLALRAPWDRKSRFLWCGAAAALAGPLLFYNSGWVQFGCRFWIQAYPFFFGLIARQPLDDKLSRVLIILSVLFCGLGLWAIRHGGWAA